MDYQDNKSFGFNFNRLKSLLTFSLPIVTNLAITPDTGDESAIGSIGYYLLDDYVVYYNGTEYRRISTYDELIAESGNILTQANNYSDSKDVITLNSAKSYSDTGDNTTLINAKNYTDTQSTNTLNNAKTYVKSIYKIVSTYAAMVPLVTGSDPIEFLVLNDENKNTVNTTYKYFPDSTTPKLMWVASIIEVI